MHEQNIRKNNVIHKKRMAYDVRTHIIVWWVSTYVCVVNTHTAHLDSNGRVQSQVRLVLTQLYKGNM